MKLFFIITTLVFLLALMFKNATINAASRFHKANKEKFDLEAGQSIVPPKYHIYSNILTIIMWLSIACLIGGGIYVAI